MSFQMINFFSIDAQIRPYSGLQLNPLRGILEEFKGNLRGVLEEFKRSLRGILGEFKRNSKIRYRKGVLFCEDKR